MNRSEISIRTLLVLCTIAAVAGCAKSEDGTVSRDSSVGANPTTTASTPAAPAQDTAGARSFAQRFYAWYVPQANKSGNAGPAWYQVLDLRAHDLSDSLSSALRRDRASQAAAVGEIVGLDFDPFLATQDACDSYAVGDAVASGTVYHVNVYGVCGGKRHAQPDVIATVMRRNTSWVFTDFQYPGPLNGHLLGILANEQQSGGSK